MILKIFINPEKETDIDIVDYLEEKDINWEIISATREEAHLLSGKTSLTSGNPTIHSGEPFKP